MNEQTTGAPLTASVGDRPAKPERLEPGHAERRVEPRAVEEREAAMRDSVLGRRAPRAPPAAHARWPVVLGALLAFAAMYGVSRLARRR